MRAITGSASSTKTPTFQTEAGTFSQISAAPVIKTLMTTASNPIPLKSVLNELGFPAGPFRLPLTPLPAADLERVMKVVRDAGELISTPAKSVDLAAAPTS